MAVRGQSRFPAAGSTAPISSVGTVGGQQPCQHFKFACVPRQFCPEDPPARHSWALAMGAPHAVFCPVQGDSHHHIPLAPVTPPCSLAHHTHAAATTLGASWLQNGASGALPWPAEPAQAQHCRVQEPHPAVQEPPLYPGAQGTCPAPECYCMTGTQGSS